MQILRRTSFTASPWKNGGGITHEAIRIPADGEPFRWRVSLARIDASGPFSDFSGYYRSMLLLSGAGISLTFSDGTRTYLRSIGEIVEFDGALSADCELLDGPCEDLNLMVSRSLEPARVSVEPLEGRRILEVAPRETLLVVPLQEGVTVTHGSDAPVSLDTGDLLVFPPGDVTASHVDSTDPAVPPLVLYVVLDDPS